MLKRPGFVLCLIAVSFVTQQRAFGVPIPPSGLQLALAADIGVTVDGTNKVTAWNDAVTSVNKVLNVFGTPTRTTASFPNGPHQVINFNGGTTSIELLTQSVNAVQPSVFVVTSFASFSSLVSSDPFTNYTFDTADSPVGDAGYAFGVRTVSGANRLVWYTGQKFTASANDSLSTTGGFNLTANIPYILEGTFATTGNAKSMAISSNGTTYSILTGNGNSSPPGIRYAGASSVNKERPFLGGLRDGQEPFTGFVAEVLVYDGIDAIQRAEVENYLAQKYFLIPEPSSFLSLALGAIGLARCRARRRK